MGIGFHSCERSNEPLEIPTGTSDGTQLSLSPTLIPKKQSMFKSLLIAIVIVVGMYMTVEIFYNQDVVVEKEVTTEVETIEVEQDAIEKAKQELERINAELDTEEAKILEERKALDARLEKIREARLGFQ